MYIEISHVQYLYMVQIYIFFALICNKYLFLGFESRGSNPRFEEGNIYQIKGGGEKEHKLYYCYIFTI